jgi:diguanylate cyclase (GGDEF)-like protein
LPCQNQQYVHPELRISDGCILSLKCPAKNSASIPLLVVNTTSMSRKSLVRPFRAEPQQRSPRKISLAWMLTVPFILQLGLVVGIVGYFSYRDGQHAVRELTGQLMDSMGVRVEQKLNNYLSMPWLVNQNISDAVLRGAMDLDLSRSPATPAVQSNIQREQYLWQQMQLFPALSWISLGTETGDTLGVWRPDRQENLQFSVSNKSTQYFGTYYATNDRGLRTTQLKVENLAFDPRTRPWYQSAVAAKQGVWTSIYTGFTPGTIFVAASQPLYSGTGKLLGVSGIDVSLSEIQKFLVDNPISPTGQVFLVEKSGLLVASSSQESPFRQLADKSPQRIDALHSATPLISATTRFITQKLDGFQAIQRSRDFQFNDAGRHYFGRVLSFYHKQGLDWSIVIVVPAADVMSKIQANTSITIWLCLLSSGFIIIVNSYLGRWLAKPIIDLSQASQDIVQGNFNYQLDPSHPNVHEISNLVVSMSQMSQEIRGSRQQLEEYSWLLEQQVIDRTQALEEEIERRSAAENELQRVNKELAEIAYLDGLTQIANRRQFDDRLLQEWRRLQREKAPLSIVMCDVDYFKQYNDTYGHGGGDECLKAVAQAIKSAARRAADLTARYGGEEFVVLLPNTPLTGALEVAKLIQGRIRNLQISRDKSAVGEYLTLSFGVSSIIPTDSYTPAELLLRADRALYQAKQAGRNQIVVSSCAV